VEDGRDAFEKPSLITDRAIIVPSLDLQGAASEDFKDDLIFTVESVKGLEFKEVILYHFFTGDYENNPMLSQGRNVSISQWPLFEEGVSPIRESFPTSFQENWREQLPYSQFMTQVFIASSRAIHELSFLEKPLTGRSPELARKAKDWINRCGSDPSGTSQALYPEEQTFAQRLTKLNEILKRIKPTSQTDLENLQKLYDRQAIVPTGTILTDGDFLLEDTAEPIAEFLTISSQHLNAIQSRTHPLDRSGKGRKSDAADIRASLEDQLLQKIKTMRKWLSKNSAPSSDESETALDSAQTSQGRTGISTLNDRRSHDQPQNRRKQAVRSPIPEEPSRPSETASSSNAGNAKEPPNVATSSQGKQPKKTSSSCVSPSNPMPLSSAQQLVVKALHKAAKQGRLKDLERSFKECKTHRVNLDVNHEGWTALTLAANAGHVDVVQTLLAAGANIDTADFKGRRALGIAVSRGHADLMQTLLDAGANVNAVDADGMTALILAAYKGRTDMVEKLLEAGSNIDAKNHDGFTALMIAIGVGQVDVVRALFAAGAKCEHQCGGS
jgi:ribosomal protein L19E